MSLRFEGFAVDKGDCEFAPLADGDGVAVYTILVDPETPMHEVCRHLLRKLPADHVEEAFRLLREPPHQGRIRWAMYGPQRRAASSFAWWTGTKLHDPALAIFILED